MTGDQATDHVLVLDAPAMLGHARQFIADRLGELGLEGLVADAQLVASELVTNVFLHVGGPADLGVAAVPAGVRVEVGDRSAARPVRLEPDGDAMTGRGLHLVEGIASRWGVTPRTAGKIVWAELADGRHASTNALLDEDSLLDLWDDGDFDAELPQPATIHLGTVPTTLLLDAKAHVDNLVREFTLIAAGSASGASTEVPSAVTRLIEVVVNGFAGPRHALKRLGMRAEAAGRRQVDVVLPVPADLEGAIAAGEAYLDALDQANAYCRAARLLTLESPPQHRILHRWYVAEYVEHLRSRSTAAPGQPLHQPQPFEERLLDEIDAFATAHRLADRGARLHSLAVALSAALTSEAVAAAVLDEGVTAMGAAAGVVMLASDSTKLAVPGVIGHSEAVMARLRNEHPDAALPAAAAMRTGEAVWLETPAERTRRFPDLIGFEPETVAMCAVPVKLGQRRLGALRFSFAEERLFDDEERSFVTALAAQTAQALHRAELHQQRLEVAERLQATLLPARLPTLPGFDVAAAYHPLTDAMEVGGDFYDVWRCAEQRWAFAIGDVCGSGPEAAAVTGLVRHTLRALTSTPLSIEEILRHLNRAMIDAAHDRTAERFCTVVLGFVSLEHGGAQIELASGGHPQPLLVHADGHVEVVELPGTILGVLDDVAVGRRRIQLTPGQSLVLVTDGATEARDGDDLLGIEGVREAVSRPAGTAAEMVATIERVVRDKGGGRLRDDLAVLALRRI